jgi:5-methylcytosine-specific restriction protein B
MLYPEGREMVSPTPEQSEGQMETKQEGVLQNGLEEILSRYLQARREEQFGKAHDLWTVFDTLERVLEEREVIAKHTMLELDWSMGQGNWARIPWFAFLDARETNTTQRGEYCIFLFRQDMSGVYLTYNQGVTALIREHGTPKAREMLRLRASDLRQRCTSLIQQGFSLDDAIDLRTDSSLGANYERSTIAYKLYPKDAVPTDQEIMNDLAVLLETYDDHMTQKHDGVIDKDHTVSDEGVSYLFRLDDGVRDLCAYIKQRGFTFEPWQIAAYVTAVRTKPFVILAGVSGTGKSKLPQLVAEATGGSAELVPVRPNWTDSSDVLGYEDLQGVFRAGPLLRLAGTAENDLETHYLDFCSDIT